MKKNLLLALCLVLSSALSAQVYFGYRGLCTLPLGQKYEELYAGSLGGDLSLSLRPLAVFELFIDAQVSPAYLNTLSTNDKVDFTSGYLGGAWLPALGPDL